MTKPNLPDWLIAELPEVKAPAVISMAGDKVRLTLPNGDYSDHEDLASVHKAANNLAFRIEDEVYHAFDQEPDGFGLFYPVSSSFSSMLMSLTDADRLRMLERDYEYSLRNHASYQADKSFYNAYQFVNSHPAFWTRRAESVDRYPWDWETSGHCERVNQFVMKVEREEDNPEAFAQGYVIALETGSHVETDDEMGRAGYTSHYHDYRLDAYGLTFESAFIELARLVDEFFYPDGTERPDVEHDKPEWVVELEARIAEADASIQEDFSK